MHYCLAAAILLALANNCFAEDSIEKGLEDVYSSHIVAQLCYENGIEITRSEFEDIKKSSKIRESSYLEKHPQLISSKDRIWKVAADKANDPDLLKKYKAAKTNPLLLVMFTMLCDTAKDEVLRFLPPPSSKPKMKNF